MIRRFIQSKNNATINEDWSGSFNNENKIANTTPILGTEKLSNPGFESWASSTNANNWTETVSGSSTVLEESTEKVSGSKSAKITVDSSANNVSVAQTISTTANKWLSFSAWLKSTVNGKNFRIVPTNTSLSDGPLTLTDQWEKYTVTAFATSTSPVMTLVRTVGSGNHITYIDDCSAKEIDITSILYGFDFENASNVSLRLVARNINSQVGVIINCDSFTNPQNFIAVVAHSSALRMYKCVAGVLTQLQSVTNVFHFNKRIQVLRLPSNVYEMRYEGKRIGTNQTVNDVGIINNNGVGFISTSEINKFKEFRVNNYISNF